MYNIKKRNIVLSVIFTIITFGIYGIYWFIKLTDEVNTVSEEPGTSGIVALILTIITLGIYGLYWGYKIGQKCDKINGNRNGSLGVIFLILALFQLQIVIYALAQDTLNGKAI